MDGSSAVQYAYRSTAPRCTRSDSCGSAGTCRTASPAAACARPREAETRDRATARRWSSLGGCPSIRPRLPRRRPPAQSSRRSRDWLVTRSLPTGRLEASAASRRKASFRTLAAFAASEERCGRRSRMLALSVAAAQTLPPTQLDQAEVSLVGGC